MTSGLLDFIYDSEIFIDLYEILEVEMDVKSDEIKMAYIKLAKKSHPDQGGSSEKFQEITRAYEILFNKETRKEYDLYYLKKNMSEFSGDEILRLKNEFKTFMTENTKPITKEELDKLYADTFDECKEQYKETRIDSEELTDKINDIKIERQNIQIETSNDNISNFISQHNNLVNVNDLFEFLKSKNTSNFPKSIMVKESETLNTLDTMPGYATGYSSFIDDNEHYNSNLYSNLNDMNSIQSTTTNENLNIDEFMQWKTTKFSDTKLSNNDIDEYLKKRQEEQENIFKEVEKNLKSETNIKKIEKFLKTKHIGENIDEYYNNLNKSSENNFTKHEIKKSNIPEIIDLNSTNLISSNELTNANSSDIDGMLKFMDEINSTTKQDFMELEKEIGIDKIEKKQDIYTELKSDSNLPKTNNIRKREFK